MIEPDPCAFINGRGVLHPEEHALQQDVHREVVVGDRGRLDRAERAAEAGVVEQHVECGRSGPSPRPPWRRRPPPWTRRCAGRRSWRRARPASASPCPRPGGRRSATSAPSSTKRRHGAGTDAARAARDHGDLAVESTGHGTPPSDDPLQGETAPDRTAAAPPPPGRAEAPPKQRQGAHPKRRQGAHPKRRQGAGPTMRVMAAWNFATMWEIVADKLPDAPALVHGDRVVALGRVRPPGRRRGPHPARRGAPRTRTRWPSTSTTAPSTSSRCSPPSRPASSRSTPTTATPTTSSSTCGTTPTRSRVVFHGTFAERIERHPRPRAQGHDLAVGRRRQRARAPTGRRPTRRRPTTADRAGRVPPWGRGDDDLLLMYTGGTTGMPKGVMWRQDSLVRAVVVERRPAASRGAGRLRRHPRADHRRPARCVLPGLPAHARHRPVHDLHRRCSGGGVVVAAREPPLRRRGAARHHRARPGQLARHRRRRLRQADAAGRSTTNPGRWDLSSLVMITSSGVMWSAAGQAGPAAPQPEHDADRRVLARPRRSGSGQSVSTRRRPGRHRQVRARRQRPGDHRRRPRRRARLGQIGRVAVRGHQPDRLLQGPGEVGGHLRAHRRRAPTRSPATTPRSRPTARLTLLGRGSVCINTGGEKVFPEEVEEILKEHPSVHDAVAVGIPDDKFGEAITAVVEADARRHDRRGRAHRLR